MVGGNPDFSGIVIGGQPDANGVMQGGVHIGKFLNALISFITVGIVLFMMIKAAGKKSDEVK